ncbi:cysteine hydrolase family protein [Anabaena azotica]|uniref:Cysteine hydrolase n=1 Tax=Anabaena azotica FACHB-119 TaxID=947527 RepID=A0ABR8DFS2_9NOST|nr:isochorismatase family cysteine hydrolase [Anabaena azotica]MBD2505378.1 cysteine hydrolase [Anabaena azotica FACHB-119]
MLENRINKRTVFYGAITLTETLPSVQLGCEKKAQAQSTSGSQHKRILLAVDLQNGFLITPECLAVVPKVVAHASQFHQVWATRFFNRNPNFSRQVNWNQMVSAQETELSPALIGVVSKTFDKPSYSPMSPALLQALQTDAITTVAVCGVDTDACVMATALGLFDAGFETFVVSDACASSGGQEYHEAAIKILKRNIGEKYVISLSELPTILSLGLATK